MATGRKSVSRTLKQLLKELSNDKLPKLSRLSLGYGTSSNSHTGGCKGEKLLTILQDPEAGAVCIPHPSYTTQATLLLTQLKAIPR